MTDEVTRLELKIEKQTLKLVEGNTITQLREMHAKAFGVAHKGKDKAKIALKIARHLVGKNGTSATAKPAPPNQKAGPTPKEEERMARNILARVRGAWDEVERLTEDRKNKIAEFSQGIANTKESIGIALKDDSTSETKKLGMVEGYWQTLVRTEQKKAEVSQEMGKLIKAARQTMKGEMDNARQLPLPMDV